MEKLKLKITSLRSIFTNSDILNAQKVSNVEITDINEISVSLAGQSLRLATGLIVGITGEIWFGTAVNKFDFTGKLVDLSQKDDKSSYLRIELVQFDRDLWKKLLDGIKGNQSRADQIFKSIKADS